MRHRPDADQTPGRGALLAQARDDAFDALQDFAGEFRHDVDCLQVLAHLLHARGPGDDGGHVRIAGTPGDGELRQRAAELPGDDVEVRHGLVLALVGEVLLREFGQESMPLARFRKDRPLFLTDPRHIWRLWSMTW